MKTMTKLVLAVLAVGFVCLGIPKANAATSDFITVTVTLTEIISVDVQPGNWAINGIALNATNVLTTCTATNDGNVAETFTINGTDGNGWTNAVAIGPNAFKLLASINAGVSWPIAVVNGVGSVLTTDVAIGAGLPFQLQYSAPSSDTQGGGVSHGFNVTVTASKYSP